MIVRRPVAFALAAALLGAAAAQSAELPTQRGQTNKPKQAQQAKTCNVGGISGVLAANGVCVKVSGYITTEFGVGQLK